MMTTLRRMFWLALVGGAGYAGWLAVRSRRDDDAPAAPEWPPLDAPTSGTAPAKAGATASSAAGVGGTGDTGSAAQAAGGETAATWVAPVDGACPDGYPIKANDNSGIFHVPGGRFYDRTVPERCYADAADAEADGYRRAKA